MGRLSLRLLGALEVRHADAPVSFATRKALALLAYLTLQSEPRTREKLTVLFWRESDPSAFQPGHLQIGRDAVLRSRPQRRGDLLAFDNKAASRIRSRGKRKDRRGARQRAVDVLTDAARRWRSEFLESFRCLLPAADHTTEEDLRRFFKRFRASSSRPSS